MGVVTSLWDQIIEYVQSEIARRLRDIGVRGTTIDGGSLGGTLGGYYRGDNLQGAPIDDAVGDAPIAGYGLIWDGVAYVLAELQTGSGAVGGYWTDEDLIDETTGDPILDETTGEAIQVQVWIPYAIGDHEHTIDGGTF